MSTLALIVGMIATGTVSTLAHHSNVAFRVDQIIEIRGVVTEWQWSNPHTWIHLSVPDGKGGNAEWRAEGRPPGVLRRAGWDRTTLAVGEKVTVHCSPAKDESRTCLVARVTKTDGTVLSNGS